MRNSEASVRWSRSSSRIATVSRRFAAIRAAEECRGAEAAFGHLRGLSMSKLVDYYFTPISPYAYLGHARFIAIARRHAAAISVKPINLGTVFPVSGGLPL